MPLALTGDEVPQSEAGHFARNRSVREFHSESEPTEPANFDRNKTQRRRDDLNGPTSFRDKVGARAVQSFIGSVSVLRTFKQY